MTIEEAEAFYKKYQGHGFHMGREEPWRYEYFKRLNLPESCLAQWDQELLDIEFEQLWSQRGKVWVRHGNILGILFRRRCDMETSVSRLLDEMEKMDSLGIGNRTHIIENMAGRNSKRDNGGVFLICTRTGQTARMKEVMAGLMKEQNSLDRSYNEAVRWYQYALAKYAKR